MSVHVQLYAYITLIYKNMGKNAKNVPKMLFLELKLIKNDTLKFSMMLCLDIKNHVKLVLK